MSKKPKPPLPPDKDTPTLSWAMVLALIEGMNLQANLWQEIEKVERIDPEAARQWKAKVDQSGCYPGAVWWARDAARTLFSKDRDAALKEVVERVGWDPTGRLKAASGKVADGFRWPEEIENILRSMNFITFGFALWSLMTTPLAYRLRQCPECETFFIDKTKNRSGIYCGPGCRRNHWNYAQRKVAGHTRFKPRKRR